jgi:hypothetical protein
MVAPASAAAMVIAACSGPGVQIATISGFSVASIFW